VDHAVVAPHAARSRNVLRLPGGRVTQLLPAKRILGVELHTTPRSRSGMHSCGAEAGLPGDRAAPIGPNASIGCERRCYREREPKSARGD
jgi:hypothetical protein